MSVVCFLDMIEHLDLELVMRDIRLKGIVHLLMLVPIDLPSVSFFTKIWKSVRTSKLR